MFISKIVKIEKPEKITFKKFQVKIWHFTAKTTLKGPKKGSQGDTLEKHKKRAFRRVRKTTFFPKTHPYKGEVEKNLIFWLSKSEKSAQKNTSI